MVIESQPLSRPHGSPLGPLRRVTLNEPASVWVGSCSGPEAVLTLAACERLPRVGRLLVVLCPPPELSAAAREALVCRLGRSADRLVVAGELSPFPTALPHVLWEADPLRAIAGTLLMLGPEDVLCILGTPTGGHTTLQTALALGSHWRGAWDEPEQGEFHRNPR